MKRLLTIFFLSFVMMGGVFVQGQNIGIEEMGDSVGVEVMGTEEGGENIYPEMTTEELETFKSNFAEFESLDLNGVNNTAGLLGISIMKNAINRGLGLLGIIALFLGIPAGFILIVQGNKDKKYSGKVKIDDKKLIDIYGNNKSLKDFSATELQAMQKTNVQKKRSLFWMVFLHIITGGIFSFLHFGLKHEDLPLLKKEGQKDVRGAKAIGFLFIPFFNIYWMFVMWLRLVKRLNFQMKLRKSKIKISREIMLIVVIVGITTNVLGNLEIIELWIGFVSIANFLILKSITIIQMQKALNILAVENNK